MEATQLITLAASAISLSGCSTIPTSNPQFTGIEAPHLDTALVYFYRPKNFIGGGVRITVRVDEIPLAVLPNCSFTYARLTVGSHAVSTPPTPAFSQTPDPITFTVGAGQKQFYLLDIDGSFSIIPVGPVRHGHPVRQESWQNLKR